MMKHEPYMYGAGCYLVTRSAAKILLQKVKKQAYKYDLRTLIRCSNKRLFYI